MVHITNIGQWEFQTYGNPVLVVSLKFSSFGGLHNFCHLNLSLRLVVLSRVMAKLGEQFGWENGFSICLIAMVLGHDGGHDSDDDWLQELIDFNRQALWLFMCLSLFFLYAYLRKSCTSMYTLALSLSVSSSAAPCARYIFYTTHYRERETPGEATVAKPQLEYPLQRG